jgi:tetratricopeptide (TPR) repeat protein
MIAYASPKWIGESNSMSDCGIASLKGTAVVLTTVVSPSRTTLVMRRMATPQIHMILPGRLEEAAAELRRSDALWPSNSANDGLRHGINRVLEARLALEEGQYDQSVQALLETARRTWPANDHELPAVYVLATLGLAEGSLRQRRSEVAAKLAEQLLERLLREPEHESLADWEARDRLLLGKALQQEGHAEEARAQLEWAIRLRERFDHPQSPWLAEARVALTSCCESK